MRAPIRERWTWRRETPRPRRLANSLPEDQQQNVRRALRHLQNVFGTLKALAQAMGVPYQSVRHAMVERRNPTAALAFRAALAAGVPMEDIVTGSWPSRITFCTTCGRRLDGRRDLKAPVG